MLPSHPLFAPFPNQFSFRWPYDRRELILEWAKHEDAIFLRPHGAALDVVWRAFTLDWNYKINAENMAVCLLENVRRRLLTRFLCLHQGEELFVNRKTGVVSLPFCPRKMRAQFSLSQSLFKELVAHQWLFCPTEHLENILEFLYADPNSDASKARQWLVSTDFTDRWDLLEFQGNQQQEFENLLRAMVTIYTIPSTSGWQFSFFEIGRKNLVRVRMHQSLPRIPPSLFQTLNAHFKIAISVHATYESPFGWTAPPLPIVKIADPTHHEKLEALMLWRDFLRGKISESEIESLLPKNL